jgi:hypothetical protein
MGISRWATLRREDAIDYWLEDLDGLALNDFADELPAAYYRDRTGKDPGAFPVLRRYEVRATVRRGCFAGAVSDVPGAIALAAPEGAGSGYWRRLPSAFSDRYDRTFHRRLIAVAISLRARLGDGTFTGPWCTAEEIVLGVILQDYSLRLAEVELGPGAVDFDDRWLQDADYLLLYDDEIAGRPEILASFAGPPLYTVNIDFEKWFKPFLNAGTIPEPITQAELCDIIAG